MVSDLILYTLYSQLLPCLVAGALVRYALCGVAVRIQWYCSLPTSLYIFFLIINALRPGIFRCFFLNPMPFDSKFNCSWFPGGYSEKSTPVLMWWLGAKQGQATELWCSSITQYRYMSTGINVLIQGHQLILFHTVKNVSFHWIKWYEILIHSAPKYFSCLTTCMHQLFL